MSQNSTQKKFLALGDSYTIGESVTPEGRWPHQLVAALNQQGFHFSLPDIIATTGWRTDQLKQAIEARKLEKNYDLVSLLIGVNNQYQGKSSNSYEPEFETLLQMAIAHAGGDASRVFVVSIPDYGFTPFGKAKQESISKALNEYNAIAERVAKKYKVAFVNITDISRKGFEDPELVAGDQLHPSAKMYTLWVERIAKQIHVK